MDKKIIAINNKIRNTISIYNDLYYSDDINNDLLEDKLVKYLNILQSEKKIIKSKIKNNPN